MTKGSEPQETIYEHLRSKGVSRRDFVKYCGALAGTMAFCGVPAPVEASGLPASLAGPQADATPLIVRAFETKPRVPVIWLEFQDCAGCTEALTRSQSPTLGDLVLNEISIDYHETLFAAAGFQAEENRDAMMQKYHGQYVLVVEGSIPVADGGIHCTIGGRTALDLLEEAAEGAAAIISTGNCSSFGGLPKADPNPTEAKGVWEIITDKPVVNIPGCPAIPEVTTAVLLQFIVFGTLPELDDLNRPKTFYGQTIHDRCLRRPFYEAGKFAKSFDDEGARKGWCLYKLGCKGPTTYNACATIKWDAGLSFPIQSGHPCLGCSQPNFWDGGGFYQGQSAPLNRPGAAAVGVAAAAGAVVGAGAATANRMKKRRAGSAEPGDEDA
ncbi:MAG: hydrogenase small subunit [Actinobacteria bacterium]|nr:hydrogenase small subunit [Actinomycetota bacterium]